MKEVTYEYWHKNSIPRMMWCWNFDEDCKVKMKVIHVLKGDCFNKYPVIAVVENDSDYQVYRHCAEIEKQSRMTNKELSMWLREKPTREYKYCNGSNDNFVYCFHPYIERCADEEVDDIILIREDDGEWREPLVEVE